MTAMPQETSNLLNPHDLLWLKAGAVGRLHASDMSLPDWALSELEGNCPVIVRRAPAVNGFVPVGIRGHLRSHRHGTYIPTSEVARITAPAMLCKCPARQERVVLPCLNAWEQLRVKAEEFPYRWGPAGSCAYELATGADWVTQTSDLDIVVHIEKSITPSQAKEMLAFFSSNGCRIDVQVITPLGGMALAEWARGARQVLLKTNYGPILTAHPWGIFQEHL